MHALVAAMASRASADADARAVDEEPAASEGALLAAVIDNRAGEVGLAVLDASSGALLLAQHVEATRTFALTL